MVSFTVGEMILQAWWKWEEMKTHEWWRTERHTYHSLGKDCVRETDPWTGCLSVALYCLHSTAGESDSSVQSDAKQMKVPRALCMCEHLSVYVINLFMSPICIYIGLFAAESAAGFCWYPADADLYCFTAFSSTKHVAICHDPASSLFILLGVWTV